VGEWLFNRPAVNRNRVRRQCRLLRRFIKPPVGAHPVGECLFNHRRLTETAFADGVGSYDGSSNHP
jgi:hypothetical protein